MRSLLWACAVLAVVSVLVAANLWRDLRAERGLAASLRTQLLESGDEERAALATAARAAMPVPLAPARAPSSTAATAQAGQATPATPAAQGASEQLAAAARAAMQQRELWKDPEFRKAQLAQSRMNVSRTHPGVVEELGLSAREADELLDLLAEHQTNMTGEASALLGNQSDAAALQEVMRRQQDASRVLDERIATLLGPGKTVQWEQYQQSLPGRTRAATLNNLLAQAGHPLSEVQLRSLTAALVVENQRQVGQRMALTRNSAGAADLTTRMVEMQTESSERVLQAAESIMNAEQLVTVRAQIAQQDALMRALGRGAAAQAQAQAPSPALQQEQR